MNDAGNTGVHWHRWPGRGFPLVLLHGIGSAGSGFAALARASGRDIWAWDMPGYGASRHLVPDWPVARDYGEALRVTLDAAGLDRVDLFGHSLGALIAGGFARACPERVRDLTLSSPALGHRTAHGTLSEATAARIAAFDRDGPEVFAGARAPRLLARPEGAALRMVQDQMAALDPRGHAQASRLLSTGDLLADAAFLTVPTRVIVGARDRITPPESAERLHAVVPEAVRGTLTLVPDAGHALATEAPAAVAACLSEKENA